MTSTQAAAQQLAIAIAHFRNAEREAERSLRALDAAPATSRRRRFPLIAALVVAVLATLVGTGSPAMAETPAEWTGSTQPGSIVIEYGEVPDVTWDRLIAMGFAGDPTDGREALYLPSDIVMVEYGTVSDAMWGDLLAMGYTGIASDQLEALYVPAAIAQATCATDSDCYEA
jgi:hypothetical protein